MWQAKAASAAWCERRHAFRSFRLGRMDALPMQDAVFRDETGKTLADFLRQAGAALGQRVCMPPLISIFQTHRKWHGTKLAERLAKRLQKFLILYLNQLFTSFFKLAK